MALIGRRRSVRMWGGSTAVGAAPPEQKLKALSLKQLARCSYVPVCSYLKQPAGREVNCGSTRKGGTVIQDDSFGTRPKKMRISQRLFIRL